MVMPPVPVSDTGVVSNFSGGELIAPHCVATAVTGAETARTIEGEPTVYAFAGPRQATSAGSPPTVAPYAATAAAAELVATFTTGLVPEWTTDMTNMG